MLRALRRLLGSATPRGMSSAAGSSEEQLFCCLFPGQPWSPDKAALLAGKLREVADSLEQSQKQGEEEEAQPDEPLSKRRRKERAARDLDFSSYQKRYVALELLYLGHNYCGFARQATTQETIEGHLFEALKQVRLVPPGDTWQELRYSRGGRTDKGVSALGQVVALLVRSQSRPGEPLPAPSAELDYPSLLNRVLPRDIRVLGWTDVPDDFSARFSARHREYKYLIAYRPPAPAPPPAAAAAAEGTDLQQAAAEATAAARQAATGAPAGAASGQAGAATAQQASGGMQQLGVELDVGRMQEAAAFFLGEHDFRNFCKVDVSQVQNFRRSILDFRVEQFPGCSWGGRRLLQLHIRGTAFLWHQVRCMASVLLMVGRGEEEPSIVRTLLDVQQTPCKPQYAFASEEPLLLYSCAYGGLSFHRSRHNYDVVRGQLEEALESHLIRAGTLHTIQQRLAADSVQQQGGIGSGGRRPRGVGAAAAVPGKHIPLLQRAKEPAVEERLIRLAGARPGAPAALRAQQVPSEHEAAGQEAAAEPMVAE